MNEYTPTTGDVRSAYTRAMRQAFIASTGEHIAEFDNWLAEVERAVAAEALYAAAEEIDLADNYEDFRSPTQDAPKGWNDESIAEALNSSGVVVDWLRNRADRMKNDD